MDYSKGVRLEDLTKLIFDGALDSSDVENFRAQIIEIDGKTYKIFPSAIEELKNEMKNDLESLIRYAVLNTNEDGNITSVNIKRGSMKRKNHSKNSILQNIGLLFIGGAISNFLAILLMSIVLQKTHFVTIFLALIVGFGLLIYNRENN